MKKFYTLSLALVCLFFTWQVQGQRVVTIPGSGDPTQPADIYPVITGDTTAAGERTDSNTIYKLENGVVYVTTEQLVNIGWPIHIEAVDLTDTDNKPIITRTPNASGNYRPILRAQDDFTLKNLWIISGERGPGEQHQWGLIRMMSPGNRIIVDHCIIEKDRGGFIQMRAGDCQVYITNSILRNGGNRFILQGNGRAFDSRNFAQDTIMIRNTIMHNIADRILRSQGSTSPHNYVEFDHCTVFNHVGRHGAFQFGKALTVKVTNNILMNPLMMGTSPIYTDEQTQPDNEAHKIFTIDTLYEETNFTFASNNIFYTQDVLDLWDGIDSVSRPAIYSDLILQRLDNPEDTYYSEPVTLNNIPMSIIQYVRDIYADPNATDMFDFIVQDAALQGTSRDFGNLFDFSAFDPCYSTDSPSATADTKGGAVGAVYFCDDLSEGTDSPGEPVRYVLIEDNADPFVAVDIYPVITGDTTATGERVSLNTIYQLQNGVVYVTTEQLVNIGWPLQIEAVDLDDTDNKPILTRIPNASGSYRPILRAQDDFTLKNLWIISGERGPGEQHQWGLIRMMSPGNRIIVDHCIIEKDRGGFIQMRAGDCQVYITNSILRNGGNRFILQGNGRAFDSRNFAQDTIIIQNTVMHNIADRILRSQGATGPHNYVEFDHCTVFNHVGRHGAFQFGKALTVKVTNNILMNPLMMGTSPIYTDEQTQPDNEAHKIFTIDTLYEETNFTFAANNIFYTQDVLDLWNGIDSVSRPAVYSDLILQRLDNPEDTYFSEELTLSSIPMSIIQYVRDIYADPNATDMFDFIVQDIALEGTQRDFGNLFDFSTFDPCYSSDALSATAGTDGGAIGAVGSCQLATSVFEPRLANTFKLSVQPNPVYETATFTYELQKRSVVRFSIYDMTGRLINTLVEDEQAAGEHRVHWMPQSGLNKGFYIARIQSEEGEMSLKLIVQ